MNDITKYKEFIDAVKFGDVRILQDVLNKLSSVEKEEIVIHNNNEMLRWSLKFGKIMISDLLLECGAKVPNDNNDDLILYICKNRDVEHLTYLLKLQAISIIPKELYLKASIEYQTNDITQWILENYHTQMKYDLNELVLLAIQNKNIKGLEVLLYHGAKINKGNKKLLSYVIENQDEEMLDFLISQGMKVTLENSNILKTVMSQPDGYPKELWIQSLVRKGADFNAIKQELSNKKYKELKRWCYDYHNLKKLSDTLNHDLVEHSHFSKPKL